METKYTVRVDRELWHRLKIQCVKEDTTLNKIIVKLIENYLDEEEKAHTTL